MHHFFAMPSLSLRNAFEQDTRSPRKLRTKSDGYVDISYIDGNTMNIDGDIMQIQVRAKNPLGHNFSLYPTLIKYDMDVEPNANKVRSLILKHK